MNTKRIWARVVAGDKVRSENGRFYEVAAIRRRGNDVEFRLAGLAKTFVKQPLDEVYVQRSEDGQAADLFGAYEVIESK